MANEQEPCIKNHCEEPDDFVDDQYDEFDEVDCELSSKIIEYSEMWSKTGEAKNEAFSVSKMSEFFLMEERMAKTELYSKLSTLTSLLILAAVLSMMFGIIMVVFGITSPFVK